jgi:hypothetical protein
MKKWYLFSELLKNSKTKPDFFISQKIDEIDFPLKHIRFIKTNINEFMFDSFNKIVETKKQLSLSEEDIYNELGTEKTIVIEFKNQKYNLLIKKNKKDCHPFKYESLLKFDNRVLTNEFIDEINKYYILISLVCAISLDESYKFIKENKSIYNINCRFIYDELLNFWTNSFKTDFCYFSNKDFSNDNVFEEREIEYSIIQFFFNCYKSELIDLSGYSGDNYRILDRIVNDKANFKWYVIFGFAIWDKIKDRFKNPDESNLEGMLRIKKLDYTVIENIFNDLIN